MSAWRFLMTGAGTPAFNMALDEVLLRGVLPTAQPPGRPVLRLYTWDPPGLSLGWFQPREAFVELAARSGAVLVRRPTGGGAIHHEQELTFALVARPGEDGYPADTVAAYELVHAALAEALAAVGARVSPRGAGRPLSTDPRAATLCFHDQTALDLVDERGRKVVGSAQRRRAGGVLHHGSLPLEVPALSPESGAVNLAAGRSVSWNELAQAVTAAFEARLTGPLCVESVSERERQAAEALAASS
ncbi:MAG: lipoate--protein ligase family protein [Planctomycetota bacterium]